MAAKKKKTKRDIDEIQNRKLDKILKILIKKQKRKVGKKPLATVGIVTAVLGALIRAATLTKTFPNEWEIVGNLILFIAVLIIIVAIVRSY